MNEQLKYFSIGLLFLLAVLGFHKVMTIPGVYKNTLGKVSKVQNNVASGLGNPINAFFPITEKNLTQWDTEHYKNIRDNGYNVKKSGGDFIFAFFPLFPKIWDVTGIASGYGIVIFNYLLFLFGFLILFNLFSTKKDIPTFLLFFTLPSMVVFFIPYTESLFFLLGALGLYGMLKKRYWIYFLSFALLAATRPSITLVLAAMASTEIYLLFLHKKWKNSITSLGLNILPLIVGTLSAAAFQYAQGAENLFTFVDVQKYWNHTLQMPKALSDWSHEGHAINIAIVSLIIFPTAWIILLRLFKKNPMQSYNHLFHPGTPEQGKQLFIFNLGGFYILGIVAFTFLFQGGNLHGLFRYILCTPLFAPVLFYLISKISNTPKRKQRFWVFGLALLTIGLYIATPFIVKPRFAHLGFLLMLIPFIVYSFTNRLKPIFQHISIGILLFLNIVWTGYLLNNFLINYWIYT
jgi:hypothetical protein